MRMGKSGEKGYMGSMEKQPSSLTAHVAAAATVIANIDVFSTASFQIHSLGFFVWGFFSLFIAQVIFTSCKGTWLRSVV